MRLSIAKEFEFEASHQLKGEIYGKCQNLHGHSYKLLVEIEGEHKEDEGWIENFELIKKRVNWKIIQRLDHKYLNDLFEIPTVENIAIWIFEELEKDIWDEKERRYWIKKIRLHETRTSYAEVNK